LGIRPTAPSRGILAGGAEADPPPAAAGDGGAAAFLHGPDALFGTDSLFGNVVALPTSDDARDPGRDDERVDDEGGVSA
jgi:hypothetical protein